MSSSYRNELTKYLADLDVSADCVIDIGGSQLPVKGRTKSWNVKNYYIGDLAQPHIDSPKPNFEVDLNSSRYNGVGGYFGMGDIVFCLEVLEYVYDPVTAFKTLHNLTKMGGTCIISAGLFYPTHNPKEEDCLRYTEYGLRKLAESVGFEITRVIPRRPETSVLELLFSSERLRPAKDYDHHALGYIVEMKK